MEIQASIELLKSGWEMMIETGQLHQVDIQMVTHPGDEETIIGVDIIQTFHDRISTQTFQDSQVNGLETLGILGLTTDQIFPAIIRVVNKNVPKWQRAEIAFEPLGAETGITYGRFKLRDQDEDWGYFPVDYRLYFACRGIEQLVSNRVTKPWSTLTIHLVPPDQVSLTFNYTGK